MVRTVLANEKLTVSFGAQVRARRQALGVSQEAFANACGLDRTYLGSIERGERNPSLCNIGRIAKALRISLSELMRGVEID